VIFRSGVSDVDIPDVTLTEYTLWQARDLGDKVALVDAVTGERLTYRELADGVEAAAGALARLGIRPGMVVALVSHNQPAYALAVHAVLAAGAVITPVNPALTTGELIKQLTVAKAVMIIGSEQAASKVTEAAAATGIVHRYVLGEAEGLRPFGELTASGAPPPSVTLDPRTAVAALPFSSGTTGQSKGVMLTHRNLVANLAQNGVGWQVTPDEVLTAVLPFFHIYGFSVILNATLRAGATAVTLPRYSRDGFLRMVQDHHATRAFFAPPMVLDMAGADVDGYDLTSLRYGICGAAPLDVDVIERAEARIGCLIRQGYGMTEASPGATHVPDADFVRAPAGSVGRLLPSTEARLVDPGTGKDSEETGELWLRGPQVMAGYLDDPTATAETLVEDGWLRTGDMVRIDEAGYVWIVDRLKELIKYKGYQVAPAELESLLLTHPQVLDAAVIGIPHAEGGEAPKAFVVVSGPLDAVELMEWVAVRVAPYKKVRSVAFIDEIPKSPSGKILRRQLR
jgi:acyl-CoA synthetase (AMP-forming)/AMP-acid ligase II